MKANKHDVFTSEALTLEEAQAVSRERTATPGRYTALANAYEDLLRRTEKIVRLSDGMQNKLRKTQEALQEATDARSAFLAFVAHEIRNPVAGIVGLCELLMADSPNISPQQAVKDIHSACTDLLALLNDSLDLSKIEAGHMQMEHIPYHPREVIDAAVRLFAQEARVKELTLRTAIGEDMPECVIGDPNRLRQIMVNLLSNALKFTSRGGVDVRAGLERVVPDGWMLYVEVADTGIGIPADAVHRIFTPYQQANAAMSRQYGGTGLGLSICRSLVELMGGEIHVVSEPGKGSSFRFTLQTGRPLSEKHDAPAPASRRDGAEPLSILLADDSTINRMIVVELLRELGCRSVKTVTDGIEALDELGCADGDATFPRLYDILLIDIEMPRLNGIETVRRLRAAEREGRSFTPNGGSLRAIALTAHSSSEVFDACRAAGINAVLQKPVTQSAMEALLRTSGLPADHEDFTILNA